MDLSTTGKAGYEASDVLEDALQLAVDEELKEDITIIDESSSSSKVNMKATNNEVNSKNFNEDSAPEQTASMMSPPRPETAPVLMPLTIEDKISMDTSKLKTTATDDTSLIVNIDDTQSDLMDNDLEDDTSLRNTSKDSTDTKSVRKSLNESTNSQDSSKSVNDKASGDESKDNTNKLEKDSSKNKSSNTQKDNKIKAKDGNTQQNGCNIWVNGLPQEAKACDLQTLFSKHGKVVSAKIIKNTRVSGNRCYGFITMENSEQVSKCIQHLNKSELHSSVIKLSRSRPTEITSKAMATRKMTVPIKKVTTKSSSAKTNTSKEADNKDTKSDEKNDEKNKSKTLDDKTDKKTVSEGSSRRDSEAKDNETRRIIRPPFHERLISLRRPTVPFRRPIPFQRAFQHNGSNIRGFHRNGFNRGGTFGRGGFTRGAMFRGGFSRGVMRPMVGIRPDVERHIRERERERRIREERRHREEVLRVEHMKRDIEREERVRFEKEKERLKFERMKLEKEKAEFFRVERERARLERERIEREREELRRRQQSQVVNQHRVDDSRTRPSVASTLATKRPFDSRGSDPFFEDRKRVQQMQRLNSSVIPGRLSFPQSTPLNNRHSIPQSYVNRSEPYKRNTRIESPISGNSRPVFDIRRHDSRHSISHDRDERKSGITTSTYNRETSRNAPFNPRERIGKFGGLRDDWKSNQYRPSERYSDRGGNTGRNSGYNSPRFNSDARSGGWGGKPSNSGHNHMSGSQQWTQSSGTRWSSSNESRNRSHTNINSGMISSSSSSLAHLYPPNQPMQGIMNAIPHSIANNNSNMGSGDRYLHNNRRF
ncbi:SAFB-like transcription modulator isoform X2 [Oppia nitens]|uniref:SAFB-like transcription modulator isoform X2 n=1 Tax=Oppia nitens TaxID=1686743 RepID=UPI0023DCCB42|nr:SAFB-like transcription modulator isoform X2 [Oppia nitens]